MTFQLFINDIDRTPVAQWEATWEERINGVGTATVTVQDRTSSGPTYGNVRDTLLIKVAGVNVFSGEITRSRVELPPGFPWRRWKISATDVNSVLDLRYIGVPDGYSWHTVDGTHHEAYDPYAVGLSSDRVTVQSIFQNYVRLPALFNGMTIGTSTYVGNYIPRNVMVDSTTGESHLHWTHTTVRSALDEMRSLAGFPVFVWIDPDHELHWTALPDPFRGSRPSLGPRPVSLASAPAIVTDTGVNGTTRIGGRGLFYEFDGTYMPQQTYVTGVTDFVYGGGSTSGTYTVVSGDTLSGIAATLGTPGGWPALYEQNRDVIGDDPDLIIPGQVLDLPGGSTATPRFQGTGWEQRHRRHGNERQILVDAQAVTEAQKDAVAKHHLKFGQRARIKGSVTVGSPDENVDGWRCGQLVTIEDARLPSTVTGKRYPIQRVSGKLVAGRTDFREYTLEWGDTPIERFSEKYQTANRRIRDKHLPARIHVVIMPTVHMAPSTAYTVHSQMVDSSHKPVRHGGVPVTWSLITRDRTGATAATGSVAAITSVTDRHGRTAATLTTGGATDLRYFVRVTTAPQT